MQVTSIGTIFILTWNIYTDAQHWSTNLLRNLIKLNFPGYSDMNRLTDMHSGNSTSYKTEELKYRSGNVETMFYERQEIRD